MTACCGDTDSDMEIRRAIGVLVARESLGLQAAVPSAGALSTNHFSFTFPVEVMTDSGSQGVFVKIPKADLRVFTPTIFPISDADRFLAEEEENSLRTLAKHWRADDLDVRWVTLRDVLPEYNAIITDRVTGDEAFQVFRGMDLRQRFGLANSGRRLRRAMERIGEALRRFHQQRSTEKIFHFSEMMPKIEYYCLELAAATNNPLPKRTLKALRQFSSWECDALETPTLKGLDIRNVLIDKQDRIFLLDPGKTKMTFREADLARFLMTYRILYWGSLQLLLLRSPDPEAEKAFLRAYYASDDVPPLLRFYLIKEQLKHWHTAVDSLQRLPWPGIVKEWVAYAYVNPFYSRLLVTELEGLPT